MWEADANDCVIPLIWNSRKARLKWSGLPEVREAGERRLTTKKHKETFRGTRNVPYHDPRVVLGLYTLVKSHYITYLSWILLYINYTTIKLLLPPEKKKIQAAINPLCIILDIAGGYIIYIEWVLLKETSWRYWSQLISNPSKTALNFVPVGLFETVIRSELRHWYLYLS